MKVASYFFSILLSLTLITLTGCDRNDDPSSTMPTAPAYTITRIAHSNTQIYNSLTDGPRYTAVQVTNNSTKNNLTLTSAPTITTNGPVSIVSTTDTNVYNGLPACDANTTLKPMQACYIFVTANQNYNKAFQTPGGFKQVLTITTSSGSSQMNVISQGYLYFGGDFNQFGNASVGTRSQSFLLAKCYFSNSTTELSCTNALPNNSYANNSIYTIATDNAGNVYLGGTFTQLGGVSASSGDLLAEFDPKTQLITNAFNDTNNPNLVGGLGTSEIDAIAFDSNNNAFITGVINSVGGISIPYAIGELLLAECNLTQGVCSKNPLQNLSSDYVSSNQINTLSIVNGTTNEYLIAGGRMDTIGNSATSHVASCTLDSSGNATTCSQLPSGSGQSTPNNFVYSSLIDGSTLYLGGTFTSIGSLSNSNAFLASCTFNSGVANCNSNGLASSMYFLDGAGATGTTIHGMALDNDGNIFLAGQFGSISNGGATTVATTTSPTTTNLVARCPLGGTTCTNLLSNATLDGANDEINAMAPNVEIIDVTSGS